jgi:CheY-like chemotaxis protein
MEYQVEGFKSVPEAVQWAQTNSFDVLLSDYYLDQGLHANDVLKAILEVKGKTFKSYVLTNYIDDNKMNELKQAGFNGVIDKPIDLAKFKSIVGV